VSTTSDRFNLIGFEKMKIKKLFIVQIFFLLTISAHAEMISIVCSNNKDGFSINIQLDESNKIVHFANTFFSAIFTPGEIIFDATLSGVTYSHTINRNNGNLRVIDRSKDIVLSPMQCTKAQQKF
jgi:hypothetical protein